MAGTRAFLFSFILLTASLTASSLAASTDDSVAPADRDKVLGAGDLVTFEILEDKEPPVTKKVTDTGDLDVPYISRVHVAGRTCAEVAAQITKLLEADYYYKATVKLAIEQFSPENKAVAIGKVFLSGDVKTPGAQPIPAGEKLTVSAAIVKAGGITQFGDMRKVKVTRKSKDGKSETFIIDVKAVLEQGRLEQDMELRDGDYVLVPRRLFSW